MGRKIQPLLRGSQGNDLTLTTKTGIASLETRFHVLPRFPEKSRQNLQVATSRRRPNPPRVEIELRRTRYRVDLMNLRLQTKLVATFADCVGRKPRPCSATIHKKLLRQLFDFAGESYCLNATGWGWCHAMDPVVKSATSCCIDVSSARECTRLLLKR